MRLAAIDIGTNTVRLKVCDLVDQRLNVVARGMEITRLGYKVNEEKRLDDRAVERTTDVLARFKRDIDTLKTDKYMVVATSAVRDATNRGDFVDHVKETTGLDVRIITGSEEARLSYVGATTGAPFTVADRDVVVIDIGGGSTELILGSGTRYKVAKSINIGSVRLTEMFVASDPPTGTEIASIRQHIKRRIDRVIGQVRQDTTGMMLVGVAGTITTIVAVRESMTVYDPDKVHLSKLVLKDMEDVLKKFTGVDMEDRRRIPGLEPKRADVIIAGVLIAIEVMRGLKSRDMIVSESDILDGAMWSLVNDSLGRGGK